jgi:hypothetical protein
VYGLFPFGIQEDLQPTYADTISLSYEREVGRRASVEFTFVDKQTRDIFEDTCNGNLGPEGPSAGAECTAYVVANLEPLKRDYQGFVVRYENRTFDWLTLLASYTYSTSEGSIGDTQNAGYDYDEFPWHWENRYGFMPDHREHRVKLNGFFIVPGDWTFSFDGFWSSNFRWTPTADTGDIPEMSGGLYFTEPRGNREGEDAYRVDLQVSKGFTLGRTRLVLIGSVFNVLSTEFVTGVCPAQSGCGGIFDQGDPDEWAQPRRYEVGFRVEF